MQKFHAVLAGLVLAVAVAVTTAGSPEADASSPVTSFTARHVAHKHKPRRKAKRRCHKARAVKGHRRHGKRRRSVCHRHKRHRAHRPGPVAPPPPPPLSVTPPSPGGPATSPPSDPPTPGPGNPPADPAPTYERVDLISNNDFEGEDPTACFAPFYDADGSVAVNTASPIAGATSLKITNNPYGRVGCDYTYPWDQGPIVGAVTAEGDVRIDSPQSGSATLDICAIVYYEDSQTPVSTCRTLTPDGGGVVHVLLAQDGANRRPRSATFQLEAAGVATVATLDNAHLWVDQVPGSGGPRGGGGSGGGGTGGGGGDGCDAGAQPAPNGPPAAGSPCDDNAAPDPATSYTPTPPHLAASHPYISLADYQQASATSGIGQKFKDYVDDAVVRHSPQYNYTPADAVVMYARSGDVKYLNGAIADVDADVSAAEAAIAGGDAPSVAGDDYLDVGREIEALALTYDYAMAHGLLSASQQQRWKAYGDQAVSNIWSPRLATWGNHPAGAFSWSGWAINNPGNNYFFSFIKATELWALATHNESWISFLQDRKFPLLEDYYAGLQGGGSREGTGYGTAQRDLYEDVRMWRASTGEALPKVIAHARATIDYWIHATVPTLNMFASIGDLSRESMPNLFDYHENLVREAVVLATGTDAARRGMWWIRANSVPDLLTQGFTLRDALMTPSDTPLAPTALTYYSPGVGQFFARSSWSQDATWLNFTAGPYDESHAHKDQGAFQLYRNGWLTETSNIFSHSGLEGNGVNGELGAEVMNVLRFEHSGDVIDQNFSNSSMTSDTSGGALHLHGDLGDAYSDNSPLVHGWTRDLTFQGNHLHVHDQCSVASGVSATFQLHVPVQPVVGSGGSITAGKLQISIAPSYTVRVVDMRPLNDGDFDSGWRLDIVNPAGCTYDVDLAANS